MTPSAFEFQHVSKTYGAKAVLTDVHLSVSQGESVGLVGVNGAGKTTLLKCMLDFCDVDSGTIEVFGVDHRQTAARAPMQFLPERFSPPYYLTGADFLKYALALQNVPFEIDKVGAVFEDIDLDMAVLKQSVRDFSKGMTQKLGLASCFLVNKPLFVLDEPMSGLDPKARVLLKNRLQKHKEAGGTLFFSSHALSDVEEICNRLVLLHDGKLSFVGTPTACLEKFETKSLEQAFMRCISEKRDKSSA